MRSNLSRVLAVLLAVMVVGAACGKKATPPASGGSSGQESSGGKLTIGSDEATNKGSEDVSGKSTFELETDNEGSTFYFKPTVLKGTAGETLTITVKNEGSALHNFSIDAQNINMDVQQGQEITAKVTFPSSGFVEFYCKYHRALGMAGELSV
jgi:plastocyanin